MNRIPPIVLTFAVLALIVFTFVPVRAQDLARVSAGEPPPAWVPPRLDAVTGLTVTAVWPHQPPVVDPSAWVVVNVAGETVIVRLHFAGFNGSAGVWTGTLPCVSGDVVVSDGVVSGAPVSGLPAAARVQCLRTFIPVAVVWR